MLSPSLRKTKMNLPAFTLLLVSAISSITGCKVPTKIAYLMDGSRSVGQEEINIQKKFLVSQSALLQLESGNAIVSALIYGSLRSRLLFMKTVEESRNQLHAKRIYLPRGIQSVKEGVQAMAGFFNSVQRNSYFKNAGVIVTSVENIEELLFSTEIKNLLKDGVNLVVLAVGHETTTRHFFQKYQITIIFVQNMKDILKHSDDVHRQICENELERIATESPNLKEENHSTKVKKESIKKGIDILPPQKHWNKHNIKNINNKDSNQIKFQNIIEFQTDPEKINTTPIPISLVTTYKTTQSYKAENDSITDGTLNQQDNKQSEWTLLENEKDKVVLNKKALENSTNLYSTKVKKDSLPAGFPYDLHGKQEMGHISNNHQSSNKENFKSVSYLPDPSVTSKTREILSFTNSSKHIENALSSTNIENTGISIGTLTNQSLTDYKFPTKGQITEEKQTVVLLKRLVNALHLISSDLSKSTADSKSQNDIVVVLLRIINKIKIISKILEHRKDQHNKKHSLSSKSMSENNWTKKVPLNKTVAKTRTSHTESITDIQDSEQAKVAENSIDRLSTNSDKDFNSNISFTTNTQDKKVTRYFYNGTEDTRYFYNGTEDKDKNKKQIIKKGTNYTSIAELNMYVELNDSKNITDNFQNNNTLEKIKNTTLGIKLPRKKLWNDHINTTIEEEGNNTNSSPTISISNKTTLTVVKEENYTNIKPTFEENSSHPMLANKPFDTIFYDQSNFLHNFGEMDGKDQNRTTAEDSRTLENTLHLKVFENQIFNGHDKLGFMNPSDSLQKPKNNKTRKQSTAKTGSLEIQNKLLFKENILPKASLVLHKSNINESGNENNLKNESNNYIQNTYGEMNSGNVQMETLVPMDKDVEPLIDGYNQTKNEVIVHDQIPRRNDKIAQKFSSFSFSILPRNRRITKMGTFWKTTSIT